MTTTIDDESHKRLPPSLVNTHRIILGCGLLLVVAVIGVAPFGGWLIRLDSVLGPHSSLPSSVFGGPGFNSALPYAIVFATATRLLGAVASWFPLIIAVFLAFVGAARMAPGHLATKLGCGLFFALGPIVVERAWVGQYGYLIGYALLPWLVISLDRSLKKSGLQQLTPAIIWALMIGCSVHFLWIGLVLIISFFVVGKPTVRRTIWAFALITAVIACSAYLWPAGTSQSSESAVGPSDLAAFQTRADPYVGLYANVAGLYGFWREGANLPKNYVGGWMFIAGAVIVLAIAGVLIARRNPKYRVIASALTLAAISGFFLALGAQGPTGSVFRWMYEHVPGFAVMREPQKFACLLALAYALLVAIAVEHLLSMSRRITAMVISVLCIALPVAYSPTLLFGNDGQSAVSVGSEWARADSAMGNGPGKVLVLPWHQYMTLPFTPKSIVGNPGDAFFRRDAIVGDNTELAGLDQQVPTRSRYLQFLYDQGPSLRSFGSQVRPLGVEYVVLIKSVDYREFAWLDVQRDLEKVFDSGQLVVYRNTDATSVGYRAPVTHVSDWGEMAGTVEAHPEARTVFEVGSNAPEALRDVGVAGSGETINVTRKNQAAMRVPGGGGAVVTDVVFDPSWVISGRKATESAVGTVGFNGAEHGLAVYSRKNTLIISYFLSVASFGALLAIAAMGRLRRPKVDALKETAD